MRKRVRRSNEVKLRRVLIGVIASALVACGSNQSASRSSPSPVVSANVLGSSAPAGLTAGYAMPSTMESNASESPGDGIRGEVVGAGAPIAQSTVTLFAASADTPKQLAQTTTDSDGGFVLSAAGAPADASLYLVATGGRPRGHGGDNPVIALLAVVGNSPRSGIVINEMTTIASVVTNNEFIDGTAISGSPLGLRIAAGNVPNFVNLQTGGFGDTILDDLNSTPTPTLVNFTTLSDILAACVARLRSDACNSLFNVTTAPGRVAPKDTLAAIESVVRYPAHKCRRLWVARRFLSTAEIRARQGLAGDSVPSVSEFCSQRLGVSVAV